MNGKIYITTNLITGQQYVGQSIRTDKMFKYYFGSGLYVSNALKKYGKENFKKEVLLENIDNIEDLNLFEIENIKKFNTLWPNGYNISEGGNGKGKHSKETKEKMSNSAKGKEKSESHKLKISESKKGCESWLKGKECSDEHKKNISNSTKGRHLSEKTEFKKGNVSPRKGIKLSEETKNKISNTKKLNNMKNQIKKG